MGWWKLSRDPEPIPDESAERNNKEIINLIKEEEEEKITRVQEPAPPNPKY